MGSMHTGLEDRRRDFDALASYFAIRARSGVGLIVTGGFSPNIRGWIKPFAARLTRSWHLPRHRKITQVVHHEGGRICLQILHAGRYGYHPLSVAPSAIRSPITPFTPHALSNRGIERTLADFTHCARLARDAGYDGVEIMGSEGYLLNQFLAAHSNHRDDMWGGDAERRMHFPVEVVRRVRQAVGKDFIVIYRLSILDLVKDGQRHSEIVNLAKAIEQAGASLINTGIGWHEARVPTIVTSVPRAAFAEISAALHQQISVPLIASNRINTPNQAEQLLASGKADLISMARPFLADPEWVSKARSGQSQRINTCIACNQACLDHVFENRRASCLVNPQACYETELRILPTVKIKHIAVVGAGPAGLACATTLAERGHGVTLYERTSEIGGQFNLAQRVPGKEEFRETLRYFHTRIKETGVTLRLNTQAEVSDLGHFDEVVIATGVSPRSIELPGIAHPKVLGYTEVLQGAPVGPSAAIIGAGGIGFDVAEYLVEAEPDLAPEPQRWMRTWGVDSASNAAGGLVHPEPPPPARKLWLLQRSAGRLGSHLHKTTGWVHRASLKARGVQMLGGVTYERIDAAGLNVRIDSVAKVLPVDNVIICAGQQSRRDLYEALSRHGIVAHLIGGAERATELDAERAIDQGTRLGAQL